MDSRPADGSNAVGSCLAVDHAHKATSFDCDFEVTLLARYPSPWHAPAFTHQCNWLGPWIFFNYNEEELNNTATKTSNYLIIKDATPTPPSPAEGCYLTHPAIEFGTAYKDVGQTFLDNVNVSDECGIKFNEPYAFSLSFDSEKGEVTFVHGSCPAVVVRSPDFYNNPGSIALYEEISKVQWTRAQCRTPCIDGPFRGCDGRLRAGAVGGVVGGVVAVAVVAVAGGVAVFYKRRNKSQANQSSRSQSLV